jgi:hypothetical protein
VSASERQRGSKRVKVFQPACMREAAGASRVHLLDVSLSGALLHSAAPPPPGTRVEIDCAGILRAGSVCWRQGTRFGLRFDLPLQPEELEVLAPAAPGASNMVVHALA